MTSPLWTWNDLVSAAEGRGDGTPSRSITGFSIDTRALQPGDVFVALKDQRDGHDFVPTAFRAGAAAAIVSESYARQPGDGALLYVPDTLKALERVGIAARARLAPEARIVAVTGSAGKTGTKEMLRACFAKVGPVHASEKSYNNHWGVPLTLARMPADVRFGVFEIGMNHADEIRPLTKMVQPHAAIVTTVEAVHIEHFPSVEAIADAKGEIFEGLVPGGAAIIKHDNPHAARLAKIAARCGARALTVGFDPAADVPGEIVEATDEGSLIAVRLDGKRKEFRVAMPGRHIAENALAVAAAIASVGADLDAALSALATLPPPAGRGQRALLNVDGGAALLIDESYNANPASMRAALATLGAVPRDKFSRRIAVLGDMLELGPQSAALHASLKRAVEDAGTDLIFACGPLMRVLYDDMPTSMRGGWAEKAAELQPAVMAAMRAGDVIMVKASNGTRLGPVVEAMKARFCKTTETRD